MSGTIGSTGYSWRPVKRPGLPVALALPLALALTAFVVLVTISLVDRLS